MTFYVVYLLFVVAIALMGYGFGWCDGRDSMRAEIQSDSDGIHRMLRERERKEREI